MLGPFYAMFVEKIGGDMLEAGTAFGIFAFVAGITTLVSSRLADSTARDEKDFIIRLLAGWAGFFLLSVCWLSQGAIFSPNFNRTGLGNLRACL